MCLMNMHIFPTDALHNGREKFKNYCVPKIKILTKREKIKKERV